MCRAWLALGILWPTGAALAQAPFYTAASIVNASDSSPGPFAPGSILSIYGTALSFGTAQLNGDNTSGARLPTTLGNITVLIDNVTAPLYYVSPTQINVMIPSNEIAGHVPLQVVRQSIAGPVVTLTLVSAAPALFVGADHFALAQDYNAKYATATTAAPAQPGDIIVLYATGLGGTQPLPSIGEIPQTAALINGFSAGALEILLNGKAIDSKSIAYAGLTPGFAGLYQINFSLPGDSPPNPQIQVSMAGQTSAGNAILAVQ